MKKNIRNPRKGVTLVELIVALSIITIITVASITMMHSSIKIEARAASIIEANKTVESIIEIYRFSDTEEQFKELCELFDESFDSSNETEYKDSENEKYKEFNFNRGAYNIYIKYYKPYEVTTNDVTTRYGNKIEIYAKHSDGKEIYNEKIVFIKG